MRIDLQNTYVANLNDSPKTAGKATESNQPENVGADVSANVQLSNIGTQASTAPEIRQDRVTQLRQAIDSGTYSVSNEALAEAMMHDLMHH